MCAVELSGIQKLKPVKNNARDINGNVVKSKLRRPNVSMVYMAGIANSLQDVSDNHRGQEESYVPVDEAKSQGSCESTDFRKIGIQKDF